MCDTAAGTNVSATLRKATETAEGIHLLLHLFLIWRPGALLVDLGRVFIANKSIQMLEGIINTQPTSDVVLGRVSTLTVSLISTFVRPYGPCTQVDIGLAARVDTRPRTTFSFGFVYIHVGNTHVPSLTRLFGLPYWSYHSGTF